MVAQISGENVMFSAIVLVPLIVEAICGAAAAMAVGCLSSKNSVGTAGNAAAGAVGGLILTWLAARIPGIAAFVTVVETAIDGMTHYTGGLTMSLLIGVGIAGLLGGALSLPLPHALRRTRAA